MGRFVRACAARAIHLEKRGGGIGKGGCTGANRTYMMG